MTDLSDVVSWVQMDAAGRGGWSSETSGGSPGWGSARAQKLLRLEYIPQKPALLAAVRLAARARPR
ncbi:hypothetical protein PH5382_01121 [Phaeobacter sp. CECT 5382]|nr:hypothetical protein PH5382_01121 [Phaeobacter sp. CECT 5382]